jgi:multidrug efflux system outer membrane protein
LAVQEMREVVLKCLIWALVCLLAVGCTVGPDYEPPPPQVPDAWKAAVAEELEQDGSPLATWWLGLNDPALIDIVDRAAESNLTLRLAAARVEEARALLGVAGGRYYPDLLLDATYARRELSDNTALPSPPGGFEAMDLYNLGVGFNWEIDLFGRIRRGVEAAGAKLEASIEDYRDVLVILLAEVAANYLDTRTLQARLEFARANVVAQRETLGLTRDRFNAGLTSGRDVAQAESNLANSEAAIPSLEAALEAAVNRLAVLLGEPPGAVDDLQASPGPIPTPDESITLGLPADLLRRRPDIRRAERQPAAQTALIGVATADLYPTFSLSGVLALESTDAGS